LCSASEDSAAKVSRIFSCVRFASWSCSAAYARSASSCCVALDRVSSRVADREAMVALDRDLACRKPIVAPSARPRTSKMSEVAFMSRSWQGRPTKHRYATPDALGSRGYVDRDGPRSRPDPLVATGGCRRAGAGDLREPRPPPALAALGARAAGKPDENPRGDGRLPARGGHKAR